MSKRNRIVQHLVLLGLLCFVGGVSLQGPLDEPRILVFSKTENPEALTHLAAKIREGGLGRSHDATACPAF